jgi:hypothetical protein
MIGQVKPSQCLLLLAEAAPVIAGTASQGKVLRQAVLKETIDLTEKTVAPD